MKSKFAVGAHVNHPAADDGSYPAGTGTVEKVIPGNTGSPATYRVKSDTTGAVLAGEFEESDLTAV